jgi:hypothetical protein
LQFAPRIHREADLRAVRRLALLLPLLLTGFVLSGCGGDEVPPPPQSFPPLRYDYLLPLRFNVASVDIENHYARTDPSDVAALSPEPPVQALTQMAQDRVLPGGSSGRAVFVIENAAILRRGPTLSGNMTVRLDVLASDGQRAGYAEASVSRIRTLGSGSEDLRSALYDMTKAMMDDMNVEFEYQVRHSLKDWLQVATPAAAVPAPVEQQNLPTPLGLKK